MLVEKTIKVTLNDEEKKICSQFEDFIKTICDKMGDDCNSCPIGSQNCLGFENILQVLLR